MNKLFRSRRRAIAWLLLALLLGALVWALLRYVSPSPPRTLTMSTGASGGAYEQFGLRYRDILKRHGVTLVLQPSAGAVENLRRLNDGSTSVAFVQGGLGTLTLNPLNDSSSSALRSLASVAFEPVWIFSRNLDLAGGLAPLAGKKIAIGVNDSGNARVATELLTTYGVMNAQGDVSSGTELIREGGVVAAQSLKAGRLDAIILVAAPQATFISDLLEDSALQLAAMTHVEGLARRFPYFQPVILKNGSVSPMRNLPSKDMALLATTANLVIHEDVHPALAFLLLDAARQTHGGASLLSRPGEFPTSTGVDFPLADESERFFKTGGPFLQRYLPFWLANFVQRLALVLVPLVVFLPLFRFIPPLLDWKHENRLFRRYGELKFLEQALSDRVLSQAEVGKALLRLDRIESEINRNRFPLDFTDRIYTLRQHVDFVRQKLALHTTTDVAAAPGPVAATSVVEPAPPAHL